MKKLRVGVAGLGRGNFFADVFSRMPECEVVAVCDVSEKALGKYEKQARHTSYDKFLGEGLDIVAVITPGPAHADQSVKALNSGAHVLCETPCVYSLAEAQSVVGAVRRTGRKYMLAEDYIWTGWAVNLKQRAEAGQFGEIVYAEGDYTHDCRDIMLMTDAGYIPYADRARHPDARKSWRATHLPPLFYTSHTLGPLLHIMEDRVVEAVGMSTGTHTAPDLGTIDLEAGLFKTARGSIVRLTNGFTISHPMALLYKLAGTKGSFEMLNAGGTSSVWYSETVVPKMSGWQAMPAGWDSLPGGIHHVEVMTRQFVRSIVENTPPPIDVYRSMEFVLPGIMAHESAMNGSRKIEIPDLRKM